MLIRDYLESNHVWFKLLLHAPVPSASKLAQSIHVPGRHVAKGVLVKSAREYFLAVLPATARVDLSRFSEVIGGESVTLAKEDEIGAVFNDCELGALPPFGRLYGLKTVVDASLSAGAEIVCVANTRHEGVRIRYRDYETLEEPIRARFATTFSSKRRVQQRRAG